MIQYKTHPRRRIDAIRVKLLNTYGKWTRKSSFAWDWENYTGKIYKPVNILADKKTTDRVRIWRNFQNSELGGWKNVVVLQPVEPVKAFRIGFSSDEGTQLCRVVLNGPTALLIGKHDTSFFAIDLDGIVLELEVVTLTTRKELGNIPLI